MEEKYVNQYNHFFIFGLSTKPSGLPSVKHLRNFVGAGQNFEGEDEATSTKIWSPGDRSVTFAQGELVCAVIAHPDTFTPLPLRRLFCSLLFVATGIAALGAIGSSRATDEGNPSATASKIDPRVIEHTANDQYAELMVVLVDQADLRPAAALATKNEKSRYVHDALWNKS
jgi:hypothetical protein